MGGGHSWMLYHHNNKMWCGRTSSAGACGGWIKAKLLRSIVPSRLPQSDPSPFLPPYILSLVDGGWENKTILGPLLDFFYWETYSQPAKATLKFYCCGQSFPLKLFVPGKIPIFHIFVLILANWMRIIRCRPPPNKSYRPGSHLLAASIKTMMSSTAKASLLLIPEDAFPFVLHHHPRKYLCIASWGKNLSESEFRGRHWSRVLALYSTLSSNRELGVLNSRRMATGPNCYEGHCWLFH